MTIKIAKLKYRILKQSSSPNNIVRSTLVVLLLSIYSSKNMLRFLYENSCIFSIKLYTQSSYK